MNGRSGGLRRRLARKRAAHAGVCEEVADHRGSALGRQSHRVRHRIQETRCGRSREVTWHRLQRRTRALCQTRVRSHRRVRRPKKQVPLPPQGGHQHRAYGAGMWRARVLLRGREPRRLPFATSPRPHCTSGRYRHGHGWPEHRHGAICGGRRHGMRRPCIRRARQRGQVVGSCLVGRLVSCDGHGQITPRGAREHLQCEEVDLETGGGARGGHHRHPLADRLVNV